MSSTFALPEQTANQAAAELGLPEEPMFLHLHFNLARVSLDRLASAFDVVLSGPRLADWACLLFGYTLLAGTAVAACWAVYIHKVMRQRRRQRQAAPASHTDDLFETGAAIVMDAWKQLCRSAAQLAVCTKVLCIMSLEIAILPVVYGVWVDICALRLLDASLVGRLAFFQRAPMSFLLLHWLLGMGILMTVAGFLSVLRNMIRPGALPWLRDPYEEEDALQQMMTMPFTMQAQREAAALLTMSLLAVVLVHIPVRLARTLAPGLYPLHFHVVDAFSEVPADMLLFHVCIPFTVPHLHIRATFRRCMMWWLRNASKLQPTQPAAATTGHVMGIDGVDDELAGRLLLLGMLLLASVIGCSTLMLTVPVTTGHAIFKLLRLPVRHDLYSTAMGLYALWGLATAAQRVCQLAQAGNSRTCLRVVTKWLRLWAKVAVLVLLSVVVLPLMVGVFIELLAMPLRLRVNESPLLFIYQDWGLGLLILKLWYRAVVSFGADNNRNAPAARPGSWRARFAVFQQQGVTGIGFGFAMTQILWPLLLGVGVLLALPYVVTRGLLPLLPLSAEALQYAFMYGFAAELAILVLGYALLQLQRALSALHNTIRDERYLVGRELNNLATRSEQCLPPARESVSYARR
ncbi:hypothetical protein WJX72_004825 [[Myrmecia] bisecta]|uniref:RING-type E3 ubiquitin transferase n=1 Tax=[Myrmecia] bisecta TaxID=41462 RepID=A0AAW1PSP3_9CHLO